MTIKGSGGIGSGEPRVIEQVQQDTAALRKAKKSGAGASSSATDITVDVSNTQEVRNALDAGETDPARRARLEEIKAQVVSGTYKFPDSEEQIKKLVSNMSDEVSDLQDLLGE